jgi:S-adenosylmethionine:tRNA ribosyltransferase-isomerase
MHFFCSCISFIDYPMNLADFDYNLPPELIAQHPPTVRGESRLLHLDGATNIDRKFAELLQLTRPGDVMVFNDTKVINARLFGEKASGGRVEVLVERVLSAESSATVLVHLRASKSPKPGSILLFGTADNRVEARMLRREDDLFVLEFLGKGEPDAYEIIAKIGALPLPPYIIHAPDAADIARYQTVYAQHRGSVAAPTAGLHFDDAILAALRARGVQLAYITLHVGAGTFRPVRDDIATHIMHSERYVVNAETAATINTSKANGGRIICVGTTSMRTLESASIDGKLQAGSTETALFVTPGYTFKLVDCLVTNFHLPKSTLLMLVSAFAGYDEIRAAYAHAIAQKYRFFSYGDAMFLSRKRG